MNCRRAEELMPLYAGGDLVDEREKFAAHLSACVACRRLAGEWAESQSLLRLHEPPEFDAAFFDPIRRAVMREITKPPATSGLAKLFAPLLRPKALASAATCALLAVVCASAVNFYSTKRLLKPVAGVIADDVASHSVIVPPKDAPGSKETVPLNPPAFRRHKPVQRDRIIPSPPVGETQTATATTPPAVSNEEAVAQVELPNSTPISNDSTPRSDGVATAPVETARNLMRIEFQTRDPNVRIIWLTPQTDERQLPQRPNDKR